MDNKFETLGLSNEVLEAIKDMGFTTPSKIQEEAIPVLLEGKDMIGQAQTGTGKTLAFGGGLLTNITPSKNKNPQAVIISPTRELAMQIYEELRRVGKYNGSRLVCVYGGSEIGTQIREIKRGCDIIIGTPGRVCDLMRRDVLVLDDARYIVLDEADEMLNMGFIEDIEFVLHRLHPQRQIILFSATMPKPIKDIAVKYMKSDYEHIAIVSKTKTATSVKQYYYETTMANHFETLCRILDVSNITTGIIFCKTKRTVDEITVKLQQAGYFVEAMHGDLSQNHRTRTLRRFKEGKVHFLIATDVAARGIDVENVTHVINYELPQDIESYIHRIGRTGRANKEGLAYSIITPKERGMLRQIERVTKSTIKKAEIPTLKSIEKAKLEMLTQTIEDTVATGKHKRFKQFVQDMDEAQVVDFTAALFALQYENMLGFSYEKDSIALTNNRRTNNGNYTKISLNVGRKDKIRVPQILEFITKNAGIRGNDIGNIAIRESVTYIDINAKSSQSVLKKCQNKSFNRRKIRVELAKY